MLFEWNCFVFSFRFVSQIIISQWNNNRCNGSFRSGDFMRLLYCRQYGGWKKIGWLHIRRNVDPHNIQMSLEWSHNVKSLSAKLSGTYWINKDSKICRVEGGNSFWKIDPSSSSAPRGKKCHVITLQGTLWSWITPKSCFTWLVII